MMKLPDSLKIGKYYFCRAGCVHERYFEVYPYHLVINGKWFVNEAYFKEISEGIDIRDKIENCDPRSDA